MGTITKFDRMLLSIAPRWAMNRIRARVAADLMARHFEAASQGRRTGGWTKRISDANTAAGPALTNLRAHSRDLVRNNGWARNGVRVIPRNVVGCGIVPKAVGKMRPELLAAWKTWAGTTQCDASGRLPFYGLQRLAAREIVESGEVLIRRRWRRPSDGLAIPMQLQVLEPDFLDTTKHAIKGQEGGWIIYGVEFDAIGRRVAYWLFEEHPGNSFAVSSMSRRIPASEIIHAYDIERAGQDRGLPWLCAAIVKLKDFDEFEDAQLMKQKVAALLAGFIKSVDDDPFQLGTGAVPPGGQTTSPSAKVSVMEPGIMQELAPGQEVSFSQPPAVTDDGFSVRTLRGIAAALGVTYEDLTGDYSQVNFSSARMSRLAHWANVYDWQWNMFIPQVCAPAWDWAMEAAALAGVVPASGAGALPTAEWTPQPMPMTDPDKEARANVIRIRSGQATLSQVIREMGMERDSFLAEYADDLRQLDALGIWLDTDVRRVSQSGLTQARPSGTGFNDDAAPAGDAGGAPASEGSPAE